MRYLVAGMIVVWRKAVSPFYRPCCRFAPTCSQYAKEAVLKHGALRGVYLAAHRILRCNPWNPGGVDLVP